jgi:hypothetical protein
MVGNRKQISNSYFARFMHLSQVRVVILFVVTVGVIFLAIPTPPKVIRDLGLALVTTGLISLIYEVMLRESFLNEMKEQLAESLASEFEVIKRIDKAGIIDIHETFPTSEVARAFSTASEVKIMQTWIPDLITLLRPLKQASMQGCTIKILLLDPSSPLAEARGKELGYSDPKTASDSIKNNLAEIVRFCRAEGIAGNIEVRLHSTIPSMSVHSYNDISYIGFYLNRIPAIQSPQFVVKGHSSYLSVIANRHFSNVWADAVSYPIT